MEFHFKDREREVLVWKIEEPISFFRDRLPEYLQGLPARQEIRNLQWMASRYVTGLLIPGSILQKDENDKPFLPDDLRYISISHTMGYASSMVSNQACGIDIELDLPRITRIAPKFNKGGDLQLIQSHNYQTRLYKIWCAKESMYKAYGLGNIAFRENISVDMEAIRLDKNDFTGSVSKEDIHLHFNLRYENINNNLHLVYGVLV